MPAFAMLAAWYWRDMFITATCRLINQLFGLDRRLMGPGMLSAKFAVISSTRGWASPTCVPRHHRRAAGRSTARADRGGL
ncbi:hypothetical protein, partial [Nonomuraea dietziae]|uniref:hypothetical protein n=1 Tax=Nonomuraea dietziae TaxID=65515 RepID=UPI0031D3847F